MDNTQNQFISLLSNSIRGNYTIDKFSDVDWNYVLELATSHKVEGVIYTAIYKSNLGSYFDANKLEELKKKTFKESVKQIIGINNLCTVFKELDKENIKFIALKGLIIRNFYPTAEKRTMNDADILVNKEDVEKAKKVLESLGYTHLADHKASHHIALVHKNYPFIELHWNIMKEDGFGNKINEFKNEAWNNTIKIKFGTTEVLSLNYNDLLVHLIMHMASHIAARGFGFRQLCDFVLVVEKKRQDMDWQYICETCKEYGFYKFLLIICAVCKKLFRLQVPIDFTSIEGSENIDEFIEFIFESGVYGKKDMVNGFANQLAFNYKGNDKNPRKGAIKRFVNFLFPKVSEMSDKYKYAKNHRILTPIAWIHHLLSGIFIKNYSVKEKFTFVTKGATISAKKNELLNWMEL